MKKYDKFIQLDKDFKPIPDVDLVQALPPGTYEANMNQQGEVYFSKINTNHDDLIDLPNTEYDIVVKEIEKFMLPNTRELFAQYGFLYKRSTLLEGPPGSGKTSLVNRISQKVRSEGGVVLFSPNPKLLEEAFRILDELQPETRVMVIFEELDQLIKDYETSLLNLLDGEIQKPNVIFLATTNYIDKIPPRIRRPGRFSSVIHVGFPTAATRHFYLTQKLGNSEDLGPWIEKSEGFSIDELKETVLAVRCLGYDLDTITDRVKANKGLIEEPKQNSDYEDDFCDDPFGLNEEHRKNVNYSLTMTGSENKR